MHTGMLCCVLVFGVRQISLLILICPLCVVVYREGRVGAPELGYFAYKFYLNISYFAWFLIGTKVLHILPLTSLDSLTMLMGRLALFQKYEIAYTCSLF